MNAAFSTGLPIISSTSAASKTFAKLDTWYSRSTATRELDELDDDELDDDELDAAAVAAAAFPLLLPAVALPLISFP